MDGKQEMFFRFMKKQWSFLPLVFFLFFTTDNLGNRRINGLYFAKSSTYVLDVVWYFIIPIIDLGIEQEFLCLGQEKRNAAAFRHKENMVWFRSGDRNSCHFDRFV